MQPLKKKYQEWSDLTGNNFGLYVLMLKQTASYFDFLGFWLNRHREQYRRMQVMIDAFSIALGMAEPSDGYFDAVADGDKQVREVLKAQHMAMRSLHKNA